MKQLGMMVALAIVGITSPVALFLMALAIVFLIPANHKKDYWHG